MKKIIIVILAFVLCYVNVYAQDYNKLAESAAQDLKVPQSQLVKFKETYITQLKEMANKKLIHAKTLDVTDICDDGGFEVKDFSNWGWTIVDNRHEGSGIVYNSTISPVTGRVLTTPITTDGLLIGGVARHANSKWEIVSAGFDPLIPSISTVHTGNYALKLGDKTDFSDPADWPWKSAESVKKSVTVNASNKILKFWYAVVTNDASRLSSHADGNAAGFGVRINSIFVPINPVPTGSSNDPIYAYNNPGLDTVTVAGHDISYLPWGCSSVDLSQYIGQTVTVEFNVFDCIYAGHFAYAYIDDICMGCDTPPTVPINKCCKNTFHVQTPSLVPPYFAGDGFTYGVEDFNVNIPNTIPITEIRVNVESFELLSKYGECLKCNNTNTYLGSIIGWGNNWGAIGTFANTLYQSDVYPPLTGNENRNEVTWQNPRGVMLNTADKFTLFYLLPAESEIPCCVDSATVCVRISYSDVNCGRCEMYNCSTIPLIRKAKTSNVQGKIMQPTPPKTLQQILQDRKKQD